MDANWALIVAAVVTAVGGIIVAVLQQFKKENAEDHQVVLGMLKMVHNSQRRTETKVDRVDERLTDHITSHLHGGMLDNGSPVHKDGVA